MDRGAWQATFHEVTESDMTEHDVRSQDIPPLTTQVSAPMSLPQEDLSTPSPTSTPSLSSYLPEFTLWHLFACVVTY